MPTDLENYMGLKRVHESTNEAVKNLMAKVKILEDENALLQRKLANCQKALDINKEIMKNALTEQNSMKDSFLEEIQELRGKLKKGLHGAIN